MKVFFIRKDKLVMNCLNYIHRYLEDKLAPWAKSGEHPVRVHERPGRDNPLL
jgi:hypothetical protein